MSHRWRFARVGGFDQAQIRTAKDLVSIGELDQKLWVALACPVRGLEHDERTLKLMDTDGDGRIRASELITAVRWIAPLLRDVETLARGEDALPLSVIDTGTDEGKLLLSAAKRILASLGKEKAEAISIDDVKDAIGAFEKQQLNGDGIVHPSSTDDAELRKLIEEGMACTESPPRDRTGAAGLDEASVRAFFEAVRARAEWLRLGKADPELAPLGAATPKAYDVFVAVRSKIDDYFARARVAAYDARALAAVNGEEKMYLEIAAKELGVSADEVARLPIAKVEVGRPLPLVEGVNPAWASKLATFRSEVAVPLLGDRNAITEEEWRFVVAKLDPYAAHLAGEKGKAVAKLGAERIEHLASSELESRLLELVAADRALEVEAKAIESVERLVRYHRDLMEIANNFVSFRDFYSRNKPAAFQVGTLYIDRRACELCVEVNDAARHATMAPLSNMYLLYCDLRNSKGETRQIAAAITAGDVDNLMVGRNGVFYDRKGVDWDATVTKIVENPIGIRQAFWAPYKKALRMIEEFIASRAAAAEARADAKLSEGVGALTASVSEGGAPADAAPAALSRPLDVGVVAALGVAVGGITAALGALLEAFFGLGIWMPLGVLGLMLLVSGPSMAVAALKLRKRNLGPLLDANGWALNAMARINVPLGESLTKVAMLPAGSERDIADPFADRPRPWRAYAVVALVVAAAVGWYLGKLDRYLPPAARSTTVLGEHAPAASTSAAGAASASAPQE